MPVIKTPANVSTVTVGGAGGGGGAASSNYGITTSALNQPWSVSNEFEGKLSLTGNADIVINGASLSDWMAQVDRRLTILRPNPELLEKYQALQQAYEHYKTLEALLYEDNKK